MLKSNRILVYIDDFYIRLATLLAIILMVAAVFLQIYWVKPRVIESNNVNTALIKARSEYNFREAVANEADDLDKYLVLIEDITHKLDKELRNSDVIFQLADLFSTHNIEVLTENYSKTRSTDAHHFFDADFKIKATYDDIQAILHELSSLTFAIHITKLSIVKEDDGIIAEIQARIVSFKG